MMPLAPSIFSLMATGLYAVVTISAFAASAGAITNRQVRWHALSWTIIAALFIILSVSRVLAWEEWLRTELRLALYSEGTYDERQKLQAPIMSVLLVISVALGALGVYRLRRRVRGRRNIVTLVALGGTGGLVFLALLRIVSLHLMDELLYGPLKLNWVIDVGSSIIVLICAVLYLRIVTGRT